MKTPKSLSLAILVLFFMLWAPLGQFEFLVEHWMKIGTYAIPFLLIASFAFLDGNKSTVWVKDFRFLGILLLIAYLIHQFEEHWIDLFGNYYAFYNFNNNTILEILGQPESSIIPLTKESIFAINTTLVWLVGFLVVSGSPKHVFPLFAMAGIMLINGLVHLLAGIAKFQYNPGLFTSIVLFIPLYFWMIKQMRYRVVRYKTYLIAGLIWAFLAHVIMVAGLLLANWYQVFSEYLYWVALVVWSIVPSILFKEAPLSLADKRE
ncbi:MAG: HXXEE domain-containing protein [Bacteroidota bacterium]